MLNNYIDLLPEWGGYLTNKEKIHLDRFEHFMYHIAAFEEEHFKRRAYEENEPGWRLSSENEMEETDFYGSFYGGKPTPAVVTKVHSEEGALKYGSRNNAGIVAQKSSDVRSYRDFYYETKLGWSAAKEHRDSNLLNRRAHVRDYLEGLHWVLYYYHKGCPSFSWYFPHLYGPLSTDMVNLNEIYDDSTNVAENDEGCKAFLFEETEPFPSLGQLLSVLPPQSSSLLPEPLGELMTLPSSPIIEFYPHEFTTDPNGKRQPWEAVVQIPFIDGDKLLDVVNSVIDSKELTVAERKRNERGESAWYKPERENGAVEAVYPPILETARRVSDRRRQSSRGGGGRGRGRGRNGGGRGRGRGRGRG